MSNYEFGYDPKYGYNRNAFEHKTPVTAVLGRVVKLIASPVGLVSEAVHAQREKKRKPSAANKLSRDPSLLENEAHSNSQSQGHQEEAYVDLPLNEANGLIASGQAVPADDQKPTHELIPEVKLDNGVEKDEAASETEESESRATEIPLTSKSGPQPAKKASKGALPTLPFSVILPQRRPRTKSRGFVRAYASVLEETGLDQQSFLAFLKDLHTHSQASPIFDVVIIATAIVGAYTDPIIGAAVQAVQVAAAIGQEIQERYRTNKFLAQANKEIFIPKRLYAMIVKVKPGSGDRPEVGTETVDIGAAAVAKYEQKASDSAAAAKDDRTKEKADLKDKMKQLRIASAETHHDGILITCAPLIFPALDAAAAAAATSRTGESKNDGVADNLKAKSKTASKFVSNYNDQRAQATYAIKHPDSTLTKQVSPIAPQFKSRYADPNNHTNQHFFTLVTGGKWKAEPLGARRRWERAQKEAAERRTKGIREQSGKRFLQEDVLYLMVVNMPPEDELEKARKEIQEAKEKRKASK